MDLFKELGEILRPEIQHKIIGANGLTCRKCKHNQAWKCNSKVFHYCAIRKSNRTENGLLKIKCKDQACSLFNNTTT